MDMRIGCSGWHYKHWRGGFYPRGVPVSRWFEHYARTFDTVELNNTHYRLPAQKTVEGWAEQAPSGFLFAVKASRLITHFRRLRATEQALETFLERVRLLRRHLGPVLFQLPPGFERDDALLREFLATLPSALTYAFEFRDRSWWHPGTYRQLERAGAAFCLYDMGEERTPRVATAPHVYLRMHGPAPGYAGSYRDRTLGYWLRELERLPASQVWIYFNNDTGGHAPRNAVTMRTLSDGRHARRAS